MLFQAEYLLKSNNKAEQSGRAAVKNFVSGYIVFAKKRSLLRIITKCTGAKMKLYQHEN